jgi:uncharacterized protein (DUF1697 family)
LRRLAALLRAVNVGGRKLAMADLKAMLGSMGFDAPQTLLASGNAVFGTDLPPLEVEERLEAALARDLGLPTQVLARDEEQLEQIVAANPFQAMAADDPSHLAVLFLRSAPAAELSVLQPYCLLGEQVAAGPGCLYIAYGGGMASSKLALAVIERRLSVVATARNWNTVLKLKARVG